MSYCPKLSTATQLGVASFNPLHFNTSQGNVSLVSSAPPPWSLIGTKTISSPITNVYFDNLLSTYQEFYVVFNDIENDSSDLILLKFSTDNGTTFLNCSYQLNTNSSSMFSYNNYIRYSSGSSGNRKTGSALVNNNISKSVWLVGSDTNLGSNGGIAAGTLFSSSAINYIQLSPAGSTNLTGGSINLYGR